MSDEQNQDRPELEGASVEELAEAKSLGWADKDAWRGPEGQWIGPKTFLEKGRGVLTVLKTNNERFSAENATLRANQSRIEAELKANKAALEALQEDAQERQAESIEDEIAAAKAEVAQASRDGDHEGVADATARLTELQAKKLAPKKEEKKEERQEGPQLHPEVKQWLLDNPEYVTSPRKAALMNAVALEMRQAGDTRIGKAFLDDVAKEVGNTLGTKKSGGFSKTEGGGGGGREGGGGGSGGSGKGYTDLPADAKQVCENQAKRFVGEGKKYKDIAAWRNVYASKYFAQENQ